MKQLRTKKGFTLIEMLVVIAIIAVLVAVVVPTVSASTTKAKAAADAANLRSMQGVLNVNVMDNGGVVASGDLTGINFPDSTSFPGAAVKVLYCPSHVIEVYYYVDSSYYGIHYFSAVAQGSEASPDVPGEGQWLN